MNLKSLAPFQEFDEKHFTKRIVHKNGESIVFILNFLTGQELPEHKHPGTEVYFFVLQGEGTLITDGKETEVAKGDIVHCPGSETLAFVNSGSEPVSVYVVLNKVPSEQYALNI
jgi:quercetin dioxygenase-like cupin family protein